jgi:predicted nucleic acid-binding protein
LEREEIPRYVPDASIAVKWFVKEEDSPRARGLKDAYLEGSIGLEAPSLLNYEVASAIRFHRVAKFNSLQFQTVMESLDELQITREPSRKEWNSALTLSIENSISMYDAVYLAFATQGNSKMVTADDTLKDAVKKEIRKSLTSLAELVL